MKIILPVIKLNERTTKNDWLYTINRVHAENTITSVCTANSTSYEYFFFVFSPLEEPLNINVQSTNDDYISRCVFLFFFFLFLRRTCIILWCRVDATETDKLSVPELRNPPKKRTVARLQTHLIRNTIFPNRSSWTSHRYRRIERIIRTNAVRTFLRNSTNGKKNILR